MSVMIPYEVGACKFCGGAFEKTTSNKRYCSSQCKRSAYEQKKAETERVKALKPWRGTFQGLCINVGIGMRRGEGYKAMAEDIGCTVEQVEEAAKYLVDNDYNLPDGGKMT